MKKILLFLLSVVLISSVAKSQPINFSWAKSMGGRGPDGNMGIAKDASGNLYVTGEFIGTRTFGTFSLTALGNSDVYVAKYSPTGTCLWAVRGGAMFSEAFGGKLAVSGNDVFVTGSFSNILEFNGLIVSSSGIKDIFVAGFDASNGTCNWLNKAGGNVEDIPYSIDLVTGGGFYLCGTFSGTAYFDTNTVSSASISNYDLFYAKYNNSGTCLWVYSLGDTGVDRAFDIEELPTGSFLLTGTYEGSVQFGPATTLTSIGYSDIFISKFDSNGVFDWAVSCGSINNNDMGYSVSFDPALNIYATGFIGDTATFGSLVINNSGGVNVFVAKFSPVGVCQWVNTGGSVFDDIGLDISTDFGGSSYVTGFITEDCFFGTTQVSGVNGVDIFIAKYDIAGTLRWITRVGTANVDRGRSIVHDTNGFSFVGGDFADLAIFGSTGLTTDPGVHGNFLTRVGGGTLGVDDVENIPFSIYPNPAKDFIRLDLQKITDSGFTVSVYTMDGKLVQSQLLSGNDVHSGYSIDVQHYTAGSYVVTMETSGGDFSRMVVVE